MKPLALIMALISLRRTSAFTATYFKRGLPPKNSSIRYLSSSESPQITAWNTPIVSERVANRKRKNNARFRQHVNPLARQYQQPTVLSDDWPRDTFTSTNKALHLDIGCGKGGFLLDMVKKAQEEIIKSSESSSELPYNYLGLEIRPGVALLAKERIPVHGAVGALDYVGCNANVDLERILERYHSQSTNKLLLQRVSIQFPDPHFKSQHAKRRVVIPSLVNTLAKYMPENSHVFLQSDVQSVLDDMRLRFRESVYFEDQLDSVDDYLKENPWGVPTEREVSVLKKDLPVYRTMLTRSSAAFIAGLDESRKAFDEEDQDQRSD